MIRTTKKLLSIIFLAGIMYSTSAAQNLQRILHLKGTKNINGIDVTVTKSGFVDSLHYCGEDTGPYYLGYNYRIDDPGDGSYTFTFSKPVDEVVFNLAAMSHSTGTYGEEAIILINGSQYKFTRLGGLNSCGESQCIITREGNISPCANCSGSGTNGVKIKGAITSFTIKCRILSGDPRGFVAGVWMAGKSSNVSEMTSYTTSMGESAAGNGKELIIEGDLENVVITIKDMNGVNVTIRYTDIEKTKILIDASEWLTGEYWLEIQKNGTIEKRMIKVP